MRKHASPRPALFSRPGTYLAAAALTAGGMVGALPAPYVAPVGVAAAVVLGVLAVLPAPGEAAPTPRHARPRRITAGVYISTLATLVVALVSATKPAPRPLESEAETGSRPLELRPLGVGRMLVGGWSDAGGDAGARRMVSAGGGSGAVAKRFPVG